MCTHRPKNSRIDIAKLCVIRDYFLRLPNPLASFSWEERERSLVVGMMACEAEGVDDPVTALTRLIERHAALDVIP